MSGACAARATIRTRNPGAVKMYSTCSRRAQTRRAMELRIPSGNRASALSRYREGAGRGFTLIELMIVMAIIAILVSIAVPIYNRSITRAKESVLRNNLFTMRTVIDEYTYDKQKAPQNLSDLVSEGYLRQIPVDPMTGSSDTWKVIMEDTLNAVNQTEPGIFDVRSGSDKTSLDGTAYSDW